MKKELGSLSKCTKKYVNRIKIKGVKNQNGKFANDLPTKKLLVRYVLLYLYLINIYFY